MGKIVKKIDWKRAGELLQAGCTTDEIVAYFGICRSTIYDRCPRDNNGMSYSDFQQVHQSKGDQILRETQYNKAIGKSKKGDNTMLILLGKHRLGQSEKLIVEHQNLDKLEEITQK